jgi:hypothetical protein
LIDTVNVNRHGRILRLRASGFGLAVGVVTQLLARGACLRRLQTRQSRLHMGSLTGAPPRFLASSLLGGLFIKAPSFHFTKDALTLHFLFQNAKRSAGPPGRDVLRRTSVSALGGSCVNHRLGIKAVLQWYTCSQFYSDWRATIPLSRLANLCQQNFLLPDAQVAAAIWKQDYWFRKISEANAVKGGGGRRIYGQVTRPMGAAAGILGRHAFGSARSQGNRKGKLAWTIWMEGMRLS